MFTSTASIIAYDNGIPSEVLDALKQALEPLEYLLPGWVQNLHVCWDGSESEAAIYANCDYAYRRHTITICPPWMEGDAYARRMQLVHDLLHAYTGLLADYASDEIKRLLPEDEAPKYHGSVLSELANRHESMTQDLTALVLKMMTAKETG